MKIAILVYDGITALDAIGPYDALARLADVSIEFVGAAIGLIRSGDHFLQLNADFDFTTVSKPDVLIVPGGSRAAIASILANEAMLSWIRSVDAQSQWTCSVCTGSLILAAAGLLSAREASTHWRAKDVLARFGARYSQARVSVDGKYMTSAGVTAGIDLGLLLCSKIAGRAIAEAVQLSMQYDPQPPFDTGDPTRAAIPERVRIIENVLRQ